MFARALSASEHKGSARTSENTSSGHFGELGHEEDGPGPLEEDPSPGASETLPTLAGPPLEEFPYRIQGRNGVHLQLEVGVDLRPK